MDRNTEAELLRYQAQILDNLRGLGRVSWKGLSSFSILSLMLRRRESYLLGELRGVNIALHIISRGKL